MNLIALGLFLRILGPMMSEMKLNLLPKMRNLRRIFSVKNPPVEESLPSSSQKKSLLQGLMSTSISRTFLKTGTGETLVESTMFPGLKISTSQPTVDLAGLKGPPAQLPTGSTLRETEPGPTWLFLLRLSLTAKLEEAVMEEILLGFINMLSLMEFPKKVARTILPKTLTNSAAQTSRNVRTVLILRDPSLGIKEIAGPLPSTLSGR